MTNNRIFRVFVMQRNPPEDKNVVWFDSEERLLKIYQNGKWEVYTPHDALLISKQDLTDKQKAQARKNINALGDEAGVIDEKHIATGAVTTDKIKDGSVTTPKIADNAVTDIKLAPLSVGASRIKNLAVTTHKIANGAVTTLKIADGAVTNDKIADDAVTNNNICPEAITIDKLEFDLEAMVSDNVKYRKQILTDAQKAQARNNIGISEYETFNDITKLSNLTAKKLLYVGESEVSIPMNVANLIEIQSSVLEVDFQDAVIKFTKPTVDWEQQFSLRALLRGNGRCRLKNVTIDTSEQDFGFINDHDANIVGGGISHIQGFGYVDNCFIINGFNFVDNSFGFRSCDHLTNCKVGGDNAPANSYSYCNYLIQCRVDNKFGGGTFTNCNFIFQCYVTGPGFDLSECSNIVTLIRVDSSGNIVETWSNDKLIVGGYDMTNMLKTISTVGSTGKTKLYAKPDDKSGIATVLLDTAPVNWAVARRTPMGTLKVKDAVEEDDAVTKKQFNDGLATIQSLTNADIDNAIN